MSLLASNHNLIDTKRGLDGEKVFYMEYVPAGLQSQLIDTKRGLDGEKVFYMEHVPAGLQSQFD